MPRSPMVALTCEDVEPELRLAPGDQPLISVVMPSRPHERCAESVATLMAQTCQDFELHLIVDPELRGQSWARNQGLDRARGLYVLFSDNDIFWSRNALWELAMALGQAQQLPRGTLAPAEFWPVYAYGGFEWRRGEEVALRLGMEPWSWQGLQQENFISTMALVDRAWLEQEKIRFDEGLRRLEDWDLWLTIGEHGGAGVGLQKVVFTTQVKQGVSWGNPMSHEDAARLVRAKHGLGG